MERNNVSTTFFLVHVGVWEGCSDNIFDFAYQFVFNAASVFNIYGYVNFKQDLKLIKEMYTFEQEYYIYWYYIHIYFFLNYHCLVSLIYYHYFKYFDCTVWNLASLLVYLIMINFYILLFSGKKNIF